MDSSLLEALELDVTCVIHALANRFRRFPSVAAGKILVSYRRHFDLNVDAIEERAGDARAIALDLQRCADAFFLRIGKKTAGARIHRGDQHDGCGIVDRAECARDRDVAVFQGLPHDLEDVAPEFRQLVEEEDAVVGEGDFTGFGYRSAADKAGIGNRLMRQRTGASR